MDGFINLVTDPAIIAIFTILSGIGGIAAIFSIRSTRNKKNITTHTEIRKEVAKKPDHIKTVATTATVLPPAHAVGGAVSDTIRVKALGSGEVPKELLMEASGLAGGLAAASQAPNVEYTTTDKDGDTLGEVITNIIDKGV